MKNNFKNKKHSIRNIILVLFVLVSFILGIVIASFYHTTKINVERTYAPLNTSPSKKETNKALENKKTLTFLIMGVDSRQDDLSGRTDALMIATINPTTKKIKIVSIPRDTFVPSQENAVTAFNKINACYVRGGVSSSISAVNDLVNIHIDHYITMNFGGLTDLIDDLGGVTVKSDMQFTMNGIDFHEGENKLNGAMALAYTRMRYDDPRGTYGRDLRQQQVIQAILTDVKQMKSIGKYKKVLETLGGNVKTDLSWEQIKNIFMEYNLAFCEVSHDTLHGEGEMINGLSFQIISNTEKTRIHEVLQKQLKDR